MMRPLAGVTEQKVAEVAEQGFAARTFWVAFRSTKAVQNPHHG